MFSTVDAAVGQDDRIGFDVALGVMGVGDVTGEVIEFGGADGTYGRRRRRRRVRLRTTARDRGVTGRRFQRRETG